jgi:hypothetical protein
MQNIDDDQAIIKASDAPGIEGKGSKTKQLELPQKYPGPPSSC